MPLRQFLDQYLDTDPFGMSRFQGLGNPQDPRTPAFNPESPNPYGRGEAVGRILSSNVNAVLPAYDSNKLGEILDEYESHYDNRPKPSGWRTAAAIGTSFLRPLARAGVPQMLATSPKERAWAEKTALLGKRLDLEGGLAKENITQRGGAAGKLAEHLGSTLKATEMYDPMTGVGRVRVAPGEGLVKTSPSGKTEEEYYNPEAVIVEPHQGVARGGKMETPPIDPRRIQDGNTLPGDPEVPIGVAPAKTAEFASEERRKNTEAEAQRDVADITGRSRMGVADITGRAQRDVAGITGRSRIDEQEVRGRYGNERERIRARALVDAARARPASGSSVVPTAVSAAIRDFGDSASRIREELFDETGRPRVRDPRAAEDMVERLRTLYDEKLAELQSRIPGYYATAPDFDEIMNRSRIVDPGWFQSDFDVEEFQNAFDEATRATFEALQEAVGQPNAASQPGVDRLLQLGVPAGFIEDFLREEGVLPPPEVATDPEVLRLWRETTGAEEQAAAPPPRGRQQSSTETAPSRSAVSQETIDELTGLNRTPAKQPFEREKPVFSQPQAPEIRTDDEVARRVQQLMSQGYSPSQAIQQARQEREATLNQDRARSAATALPSGPNEAILKYMGVR